MSEREYDFSLILSGLTELTEDQAEVPGDAAGGPQNMVSADARRDLARLKLLRDLYAQPGVEPMLMLDVNEALTAKEAVRHVGLIEREIDLTWIEEPVRRWDAPGLATVRAGVRAAVATGENLTGLESFAPLFRADAVDVVQASMVYGVTHFMRLAAAAHLHNLPISLVSYRCNLVAHAANAVANHRLCEIKELTEQPEGLSLDQEVVDGGLRLGRAAGGRPVQQLAAAALVRARLDRDARRGVYLQRHR
jgi:L-alanine-DL-glutamate epimerase-like enolase superfamily enzyme